MSKKYKIPTLINGRASCEATVITPGQRSTLPGERKSNISVQYATQTHSRNKILLLGDSHIRGLAERMNSSLGSSFSVTGITKPNANIKGITSSSDSSLANLTKQDMIIFCGGTRDISRNESKSGLSVLQEFAQRTCNTNIILLEVPTRYDLPHSSCVNAEVKLFTRHVLHLPKKAKNWIAVNLVREIMKPHHSTKTNPPIVIHWKDVVKTTTQQTYPDTPSRIYDNTEPSSPGEMRSNGRRMEAKGEQEDEVRQQPAQTPQQAQPVPPQ